MITSPSFLNSKAHCNVLDIMAFCESSGDHLFSRTTVHHMMLTTKDQYVSPCCKQTCFTGINCCPWLHKANSHQVMERLSTADKWPEDGGRAEIRLMLCESVMMWIYIQSSSKREAQFLSRGCVLLVLSHSHTQPQLGAPQEGSPRRPPAQKHSSNRTDARPGQSLRSEVIEKEKCLRY